MADVKILATGLGFPEGPVVCADGSVVLTEIRNGRCTRVGIGPDSQDAVAFDQQRAGKWRTPSAIDDQSVLQQ